MDEHLVSILTNIGGFTFIALSAYLLLLTGEISFGQQAFFGIGAYFSGIVTAMWGLSMWAAIPLTMLAAAFAAGLVGIITIRLRGLYFSIATLAFAEMVRLALVGTTWQIKIDGEMVGPNGSEGLGNIRWALDNDIEANDFMWIVLITLAIVMGLFFLMERSRLGSIFRTIGADRLLAETQGINVTAYKVAATALAGAIASLGGIFYAHAQTHVYPENFDVMLGVHSLAYGLIGGLGTAFGPVLGVILDIGFLEAVEWVQGYRMIAFGGLVALLLIFMPRGILDERRVHRLRMAFRTRKSEPPPAETHGPAAS
jgi:branched-chain amino acid transport system permease protein